MNKELLLLVK